MKRGIALILALVCMLGLMGCSGKYITFDIGAASEINIKSGLTGDEVIIADSEFIQEITGNINSLRFEKTSATDGEVSYVYTLTWFDTEDKQIAKVTITEENGHQINSNGYYYKVGSDLSINVELIAEMLNIALSSQPQQVQRISALLTPMKRPLPTPMVEARAVVRAWNWLTSPGESGSFVTDSLMPVRVLRWMNPVRNVINRWVPSSRTILGTHPYEIIQPGHDL